MRSKGVFADYTLCAENQPLSDVLLYHHHSDPQIQGMVAQVLGVLIHARVHCTQLINITSSQGTNAKLSFPTVIINKTCLDYKFGYI